jgi:hypothetical protein
MNTQNQIKAPGISYNHNQTLVRPVPGITYNHNQTLVKAR